MSGIVENIKRIQTELPQGVTLVAVSKFHPIEALKEAYDCGQRIFAESRAQELMQKVDKMPADTVWHFIGHLQTNKVKAVLPHVAMIQSVDSEKLLTAINAEARKEERRIDVLLELHVAQEETKFGFSVEDCERLVNSGTLAEMTGVRVCGVMGMATNTDDDGEIRREFQAIRSVFDRLKGGCMKENVDFSVVSMGMSDDYPLAIMEKTTMVRLGSCIFGPRQY